MTQIDLRWVAESIENPPPEPPELIKGMVRAGELCVVGAPRAVGKSWFMANLAVLLGRGEGLLMGNLPVLRSVPVLYCNGELDPWASARRWRMLVGSEVPRHIAESFDPWRLRVRRMRSTTQSEAGALSEEWLEGVLDPGIGWVIEVHGFLVLIIDPWASFYGGDENSNDQTEAALGTLRALALQYGVAIVIVHHLSKSTDTRDPEDLWRGASRLADWASTRVTLLPHFTEKGATDAGLSSVEARRYVDVRFLRRHEPTEPFSAVLGHDGWWRSWHPEAIRPVGRMSPSDVAEECRRGGGRWGSVVEARASLGFSKETTAVLLREAVEAGLLIQEAGRGAAKAYRLADQDTEIAQEYLLDFEAERKRRGST
jgi:hypothetical protein